MMNKRLAVRLCAMLLFCACLSGCAANNTAREDTPVTLTWYMQTDYLDLYNSLEGIKEIERATGVDIVFQAPPDNSMDAFKMMIASGRLPDIIMWQYTSGTDRLFTDNIAIDLTDLIAQHAPALTAIYQERPEIRAEVASADGRLYYFPSINPMLTKEEIGRKSYNGLVIRSDWLDKLGLSAPDTIEQWYETLSAFKLRDPNGNGLADEIPFDGWGLPYFAPAFGVLNTICVKSDGTVAFGPMEQEYKAYLETMNKWYAEGLLGSNCLVHSEKWKQENIVGNLTGAFCGLDNAWRYYLPPLREKEPSADFLALPWTKADNGVRYTARAEMASHVANTVTVVTPQCKNPEAAVRLIDYFYTREGGDLLHWGIKDVTYTEQDGVKTLTPYALSTAEEGYLTLYYYAIGHTVFPKYDGETVVLASYPEDQLTAEWTWADASTALIYPPAIAMTTRDQETCDRILSDVNSYFTETEMRFITGQEPLSNFDSFVSNLRRMNIDEALDIYRRYYAEYSAKGVTP